MRMVFGLVLLVGIALAGGAVYLAKDRIGQYQIANAQARAALDKIVPTRNVYVAEGPLKYGQQLRPEDVRVVAWPENAIPEGTFEEEEVLFPSNTDELRYVLRTIEKDEAIMAVKVTEPGEDVGLTSQLGDGFRAVTLKVDAASGVSGFLRPGNHVDVYWTGRVDLDGQRSSGEVTKLIQSSVKIIAVDQTSSNRDGLEASIAQTVTVAVDRTQGGGLILAQQTGKLTFSLVGMNDTTVAEAVEIDQRTLLGIERPETIAEVQKKKVCTIRTGRGTERVEVEIACPDATN